MLRAYLTEKQMPRRFWFHSIRHSAQMMNHIPAKYGNKLPPPFMLVRGPQDDCCSWLPLFSLYHFHHDTDGPIKCSKNQAQTMEGIIISRCPDSNAALVYNPHNKNFYQPETYRIDPHRLPGSIYLNIKYDGGLFCALKRDKNPSQDEEFPPGIRVEQQHPTTKMLCSGVVVDIPLDLSQPDESKSYLIQFDDSTSMSVPASEMHLLILKSPQVDEAAQDTHLPPFLQVGKKITFDHEGQFCKGYLGCKDGVRRFSCKRHPNSKHEERGIPLHDLPHTWSELCVGGSLSPGHNASSFICGSSDPVANIISAVDLHNDCPYSLLQALADNHPDRELWLNSFYEEKDSIKSMNTYRKITLGKYRALHEKGASRAIPTMCVLTIKRDENLLPVRAKTRIVVFSNHEDRVWTKSEKFAPVLCADSLRYILSMAVQKRRLLKQGDCKNAFCNGDLPKDEVTIVRPPNGDPSAAKYKF